MSKQNKKEPRPLTKIEIQVDIEKRIKATNLEIEKLLKKNEMAIGVELAYTPRGIFPTAKLISTKNYEQKEGEQPSNQNQPA